MSKDDSALETRVKTLELAVSNRAARLMIAALVGREEPDMRPVTVVVVCVVAVGIVLGAGTPSASAEGCALTCSVGGAGTGGESSDGKAEGFRLEGASTGFPGSTFTNQGNEIAGHISVTGASEGMASGAFTPQGVLVGHWTGVSAIFFGLDGDCNGVCG